jgi:hypothetical protein
MLNTQAINEQLQARIEAILSGPQTRPATAQDAELVRDVLGMARIPATVKIGSAPYVYVTLSTMANEPAARAQLEQIGYIPGEGYAAILSINVRFEGRGQSLMLPFSPTVSEDFVDGILTPEAEYAREEVRA